MNTTTKSQEVRDFCAAASAPSFDMMGKGHLIVNGKLGSWELPTVEEMMRPDYKPRNVYADGSWIPS